MLSQDASYGSRENVPRAPSLFQRGSSGGSDGVDLPIAAPSLFLPLSDNETFLLKGVKGRVKCAFLASQRILRASLDFASDSVPVTRTGLENGKYQGGGIAFKHLMFRIHRLAPFPDLFDHTSDSDVCQARIVRVGLRETEGLRLRKVSPCAAGQITR